MPWALAAAHSLPQPATGGMRAGRGRAAKRGCRAEPASRWVSRPHCWPLLRNSSLGTAVMGRRDPALPVSSAHPGSTTPLTLAPTLAYPHIPPRLPSLPSHHTCSPLPAWHALPGLACPGPGSAGQLPCVRQQRAAAVQRSHVSVRALLEGGQEPPTASASHTGTLSLCLLSPVPCAPPGQAALSGSVPPLGSGSHPAAATPSSGELQEERTHPAGCRTLSGSSPSPWDSIPWDLCWP